MGSDNSALEAARREITYASTGLRGIAIFAVMAIHFTSQPLWEEVYPNRLFALAMIVISAFSHFAVPLFMTLSIFSLSLNPIKKGGVWKFYANKLPRLVIPYLAYSVLYIASRIILGHETFTLPDIARKILLTGTAQWHLWFIYTLILLFVLHPFARKFHRRFVSGRPIVLLILLFVQVAMAFVIMRAYTPNTVFNRIQFPLLECPLWLNWWFLFGGYYLYENTDRALNFARWGTGRWLTGLAVGFCLSVITGFWIYYFIHHITFKEIGNVHTAIYIIAPLLGVPVTVFLVGWTGRLSGWFAKMIKSFGLYSYGVYLIHWAFFALIGRLSLTLFDVSKSGYMYQVICFGLTPLLSLVTIKGISKTPLRDILL